MTIQTLAIFAACVVAIVLFTKGSAQEPSISISPSSGPCGTVVEVTGTGFPANTDMLVAVALVRNGGGFEGEPPTTRTDASGKFSVSVQVPVQSCPWPRGYVVGACVHIICEPRVSVPFTVLETNDLPTAGTGSASPTSHSAFIAAALACLGAILVASAFASRLKRGTD